MSVGTQPDSLAQKGAVVMGHPGLDRHPPSRSTVVLIGLIEVVFPQGGNNGHFPGRARGEEMGMSV